MRRREFITLLGGAVAWSVAARAQQRERMRRIGVLLPTTADDADYQAWVGAFLQVGEVSSIERPRGLPVPRPLEGNHPAQVSRRCKAERRQLRSRRATLWRRRSCTGCWS